MNSRQIQLNNVSLRILGEVEILHELTYPHRQEERLLAAALVPMPRMRSVERSACTRNQQEPFAKLRGTLDLALLSLEDATVADKRSRQICSRRNPNYLGQTESRIRLSSSKGVEKHPSEVFPTGFSWWPNFWAFSDIVDHSSGGCKCLNGGSPAQIVL